MYQLINSLSLTWIEFTGREESFGLLAPHRLLDNLSSLISCTLPITRLGLQSKANSLSP